MAVTIGTPIVSAGGAFLSSATAASVVTSGSDLFVLAVVVWGRTQTVTSVVWDPTGAAVSLSLIGSVQDPTATRTVAFYGADGGDGITASTEDVTVTMSGAVSEALNIAAYPFSGVNQTTPTSDFSTASNTVGSGGTPQPSVDVTTASGRYVVNGMTTDDTAVTFDAQDTAVMNTGSGGSLGRYSGYRLADATTETVTYTALGNFTSWGIAAVSVDEAAAAVPDNIVFQPIFRPRLFRYL